jgi:hypothetical protein
MYYKVKSWHYARQFDHLSISFSDSSSSYCRGSLNGVDFFGESDSGPCTGIDITDFQATWDEIHKMDDLGIERDDLSAIYCNILIGYDKG